MDRIKKIGCLKKNRGKTQNTTSTTPAGMSSNPIKATKVNSGLVMWVKCQAGRKEEQRKKKRCGGRRMTDEPENTSDDQEIKKRGSSPNLIGR